MCWSLAGLVRIHYIPSCQHIVSTLVNTIMFEGRMRGVSSVGDWWPRIVGGMSNVSLTLMWTLIKKNQFRKKKPWTRLMAQFAGFYHWVSPLSHLTNWKGMVGVSVHTQPDEYQLVHTSPSEIRFFFYKYKLMVWKWWFLY